MKLGYCNSSTGKKKRKTTYETLKSRIIDQKHTAKNENYSCNVW